MNELQKTIADLLKSACKTKAYAIEQANQLTEKFPEQLDAVVILKYISHVLLKDFREDFDEHQ